MVDRTDGWTCSIFPCMDMSFEQLDKDGSDPINRLLFEKEVPISFCSIIEYEKDAQKAARQVIRTVFQESIPKWKMRVEHNKNGLWIVSCRPYIIAFDEKGNLVLCMDSSQYEWTKMINYSSLPLMIDIAQISLQDLPYYEQYAYGLLRTVKYRLRNGGKTESPSAEDAYNNAVILADYIHDYRYGYDLDEFRVYTSQENNAWIVIAWLFVAVFAMETGELVFCVGTEGTGFEYDYSQRS